MKLYKAELIAQFVMTNLAPHCVQLIVAGSVRRKSPEVHDIELVIQPRTATLIQDLFNPSLRTETVSDGFIQAVHGLGTILKGKPSGRYCQVLTNTGVSLDLFIPQRHDFYRMVAIRTGSAQYSQYIAKRWNEKGWCGTSAGLRLISECERVESSGTWVVMAQTPTLPPAWNSEEAFFAWLGMPFLDPEKRYLDGTPAQDQRHIQEKIDLGEFTPNPEP